jgi:hypothetical protein
MIVFDIKGGRLCFETPGFECKFTKRGILDDAVRDQRNNLKILKLLFLYAMPLS